MFLDFSRDLSSVQTDGSGCAEALHNLIEGELVPFEISEICGRSASCELRCKPEA